MEFLSQNIKGQRPLERTRLRKKGSIKWILEKRVLDS
jgi:hypothetical protein